MFMEIQRKPDIVVISDVHLGTYGCHAEHLLDYLLKTDPRILIINGDFIDIWQFRKNYFPRSHLSVLQRVLQMANQGVKVYYLPGNHDDLLRTFNGSILGPIQLRDQLILQLHGKTHWFFHGDIFDASVRISPFIAKLGGFSYDQLVRLNRLINGWRSRIGMSPMSFSKLVKTRVKKAVKFIGDFEKCAIDLAFEREFDYVVCGHIHIPQQRQETRQEHTVHYLNSGDWVESLTALEYLDGQWSLYHHDPSQLVQEAVEIKLEKQVDSLLEPFRKAAGWNVAFNDIG